MIPKFLLIVSQDAPAIGHGGATCLSYRISPVIASMVRTMFSVDAVKTICFLDASV